MVEITRRARFSSGARYWLDRLSPGENAALFGRAAGPSGTGHDYVVDVTVEGKADARTGMVVNVADLKLLLLDALVRPLEGGFLAEGHALLHELPPLPECLALAAWSVLKAGVEERFDGARLKAVRVQATPRWWGSAALAESVGAGGYPMLAMTRVYEFAAAHRLHSEELEGAANVELFGKCNNPSGHGHNYILEVTVGGSVDTATGAVFPVPELDRVVHEQVVDRYDHKHLNLDVPEFRGMNPTSENVVRTIWDRLSAELPAGVLRKVLLRETERNYFAYSGDGQGEPE